MQHLISSIDLQLSVQLNYAVYQIEKVLKSDTSFPNLILNEGLNFSNKVLILIYSSQLN